MNIEIINRFTKESIMVPLAAFKDYCDKQKWNYDEVKVVFNRPGIHYEDNFFVLHEKEEKTVKKEKEKKTNE